MIELPAFQIMRHQHQGLVRSLVEASVARVFGTSALQMRSPHRGVAKVAFARHVAIYLSHVAFGLSYTAVGRVFGRDRTTVRYACAAIEDRRDDVRFDIVLSVLEGALVVAVRAILQGHASDATCHYATSRDANPAGGMA